SLILVRIIMREVREFECMSRRLSDRRANAHHAPREKRGAAEHRQEGEQKELAHALALGPPARQCLEVVDLAFEASNPVHHGQLSSESEFRSDGQVHTANPSFGTSRLIFGLAFAHGFRRPHPSALCQPTQLAHLTSTWWFLRSVLQ